MADLGIITNPTAGRNRSRIERVRAWTEATGALSREVADLDSIVAATRDLLATGVDVLAVNGGDGTAQAVLTLLAGFDGDWPDVALLPGGTTNMSANDINGTSRLMKSLKRLAEQAALPAEKRSRVMRPLLRVSAEGLADQYGFCASAGVVLRGMRHFREFVGARGLRGELATGISVFRGLAGVARNSGGWSDTPPVTVTIADSEETWTDQILVVATSLDRLMLGFTPWWGEGDGPLHLFALARGPQGLIRQAPSMLRGRPNPGLTPERGYRSAEVTGVRLEGVDGFALDGEILPVGADGALTVAATPPVSLLAL
jgi:hypothetical protein